ncbi:MAG TPA: site-specific integrase, partial [Thermoplasmata archaeon]|nr:site-specific integrase [Thermoplasmata archaeon]
TISFPSVRAFDRPSHNTWVERWIAAKKRRGVLEESLVRYRRVALRAIGSLHPRRRARDPRNWTVEDGLQLRDALHNSRWLYAIATDFSRFFGNPALAEAGIPGPKSSGRVRWLSGPEVTALIRLSRSDPLLAFLVILGLGQGMRRVEWRRLQVGDVDLASGRILIRGKGRGSPKLQWAPLHPDFRAIYGRYLQRRSRIVAAARGRDPHLRVPEEVLIHSYRGQLRGYSSGGLDLKLRNLERLLHQRGWLTRLSSHMLRRSGATLLEEALLRSPRGAPDGAYRAVQGFLRHENLATTMRYLQANPDRQRRAMDTFAQFVTWPSPRRLRGARGA